MTTQTLLHKIPENTSLFQSRKYTFVFPTMPFLNYMIQSVALPRIGTSAPVQSSPFADLHRHGDKLQYDPITITCLLDEDLRVWEETHNWLVALTKPQMFPQYFRNSNGKQTGYHDAILTINNNANIPNIRIKFTNCHPLDVSSIALDTTVNADVAQTVDFQFRYDWFEIQRLT